MFVQRWTTRLLAVAGLFTGAAALRADETVRLVLSADNSAPTVILGKESIEADTLDARWGGGHFHGGFHGRFHGGFHGHVFHRGFHGHGFSGGFYGRGFYGGFYAYRPSFVYSYGGYSSFYYYPSYSCYPISQTVTTVTPSVALSIRPATPIMPPADAPPSQLQTLPRPMPEDGTYPYDGGPRAPVPMPKADPTKGAPQKTVPLEGRPVSLPAEKPVAKYVYRAYGEK
jgi:hypothetical protein